MTSEERIFISPITLTEAKIFISSHHRHHKPPVGGLYAIAVSQKTSVIGVVVVGRPVSRMADNGWTAEVTRVCTLGHKNVCSMLYQAAWRAARAMGYKKLITYTLPEEGGASLRAAGWKCLGEAGGGSWNRKERPRVDQHPTQTKMKWEREA